jgi:flagellar protein FlgJ
MDVSGISHVKASDIAPDRLANNASLTEKEKLSEASRQFEAILLRQILESTQKTVISSKFSDNSTASGIYRDMISTQLADSISKSGALGLAQTFEAQLSKQDKLTGAGGGAAKHAASTLHATTAPASRLPGNLTAEEEYATSLRRRLLERETGETFGAPANNIDHE